MVGGALLMAGCAATGPSPMAYGTHAFRGAERTEVFDAAELALLKAGFQIERRDSVEGVLTTQPIFGSRDSDADNRGPRLSSRGDVRRLAEVRVQTVAADVDVYCRVLVQEQSAQVYHIVDQRSGSDDRPNTTPIDRDAATTTQQNTVWRTLRRDKVVERQILADISERVERAGSLERSGQGE